MAAVVYNLCSDILAPPNILKANTREKRFCYSNKIICKNRDNKNILLQQQNVWFYQQNVWLLRQNFLLQLQKFHLLSLILLP